MHLPGDKHKAMDVFGPDWENHFEKIRDDWLSKVADNDIVLLPGDLSWSQDISGAAADLASLGNLPGVKVMIRGNHDFWWSSIAKVRACLPRNMYALQNDSVLLGDVLICGSRGWVLPEEGSPTYDEDVKIHKRELIRLRMSLESGIRLGNNARAFSRLIVMTHYPPLYRYRMDTEYTALFNEFGASDVVYGHLHGEGFTSGFNGVHMGIRYHLASCDALGFRLAEIT